MSFRSRPRCWRSGSTRSSGGTRSRRSTIRWSSPPDPPSDRNPSALARRTELTGPRASRNTRSIWPTFAIRRLTRRPFETNRSIFWKVDHFIFRRFRAPPPQQLFECFWNPRQLKLDGWIYYSEIVKKISRRCFETKFQVNWIYDVIVMKSDSGFFVLEANNCKNCKNCKNCNICARIWQKHLSEKQHLVFQLQPDLRSEEELGNPWATKMPPEINFSSCSFVSNPTWHPFLPFHNSPPHPNTELTPDAFSCAFFQYCPQRFLHQRCLAAS